MQIILSWSSGKDSAWALHVLNQRHPGAVCALLTTINEAFGRVAMHGVRDVIVHSQAEALGLLSSAKNRPAQIPADLGIVRPADR